MQLLEIYSKLENKCLMCTNYEECINYDEIASRIATGRYTIRIGGKVATKNTAPALVKAALAAGIGVPFKGVNISEPAASDTSPVVRANKSVRCIDTGEVFKTQSEAAKHFGIDPAQVSDSIKTGRPRSGHTFEKIEE